MLILTRKIGEGIFLGDDIRISILEIRGKQIRIGIEAPSHIVVLREEIYQRVQEENLRAAGVRDVDLKEIAKIWQPKKENEPGS